MGYVPRNEKLSVESRHLETKQAFGPNATAELEEKRDLFRKIGEECLNLRRFWRC